jgi:hypothetical protein
LVIFAIFFFLPKSEVLLEKFDNAFGITEVVFLQLIDLVESILQSLVSEFTCSLVILHNFVVEN